MKTMSTLWRREGRSTLDNRKEMIYHLKTIS
jgi:hypothetical protein